MGFGHIETRTYTGVIPDLVCDYCGFRQQDELLDPLQMIGDGGAAWGITAQIRGKRWLQLTAGAR
eukprot:COSAG02_NODE_40143_length_408_cov_8.055016_2_plen_64_part_01